MAPYYLIPYEANDETMKPLATADANGRCFLGGPAGGPYAVNVSAVEAFLKGILQVTYRTSSPLGKISMARGTIFVVTRQLDGRTEPLSMPERRAIRDALFEALDDRFAELSYRVSLDPGGVRAADAVAGGQTVGGVLTGLRRVSLYDLIGLSRAIPTRREPHVATRFYGGVGQGIGREDVNQPASRAIVEPSGASPDAHRSSERLRDHKEQQQRTPSLSGEFGKDGFGDLFWVGEMANGALLDPLPEEPEVPEGFLRAGNVGFAQDTPLIWIPKVFHDYFEEPGASKYLFETGNGLGLRLYPRAPRALQPDEKAAAAAQAGTAQADAEIAARLANSCIYRLQGNELVTITYRARASALGRGSGGAMRADPVGEAEYRWQLRAGTDAEEGRNLATVLGLDEKFRVRPPGGFDEVRITIKPAASSGFATDVDLNMESEIQYWKSFTTRPPAKRNAPKNSKPLRPRDFVKRTLPAIFSLKKQKGPWITGHRSVTRAGEVLKAEVGDRQSAGKVMSDFFRETRPSKKWRDTSNKEDLGSATAFASYVISKDLLGKKAWDDRLKASPALRWDNSRDPRIENEDVDDGWNQAIEDSQDAGASAPAAGDAKMSASAGVPMAVDASAAASPTPLRTLQEWCHLIGHGDGGVEVPENFISGSKHCNTEQLAIETGHRAARRLFSMPNGESIQLTAKVTAYIFPSSDEVRAKSNLSPIEVTFLQELYRKQVTPGDVLKTVEQMKTYLYEQQPGMQNPLEALLIRGKANEPFAVKEGSLAIPTFDQYDRLSGADQRRVAKNIVARLTDIVLRPMPLGNFVRYKLFVPESAAAGGAAAKPRKRKVFDHVFDAQKESFDLNEFNILEMTVRRVIAEATDNLVAYRTALKTKAAQIASKTGKAGGAAAPAGNGLADAKGGVAPGSQDHAVSAAGTSAMDVVGATGGSNSAGQDPAAAAGAPAAMAISSGAGVSPSVPASGTSGRGASSGQSAAAPAAASAAMDADDGGDAKSSGPVAGTSGHSAASGQGASASAGASSAMDTNDGVGVSPFGPASGTSGRGAVSGQDAAAPPVASAAARTDGSADAKSSGPVVGTSGRSAAGGQIPPASAATSPATADDEAYAAAAAMDVDHGGADSEDDDAADADMDNAATFGADAKRATSSRRKRKETTDINAAAPAAKRARTKPSDNKGRAAGAAAAAGRGTAGNDTAATGAGPGGGSDVAMTPGPNANKP